MSEPGREPDRESGLFRFLFVDTTFGSLLGLLLVIGGLAAYEAMVKEATPDLAIPIAVVSTNWPGAEPPLVEKDVTLVLERGIRSLSRVKQITSTSTTGRSTIMVEFDADAPVEASIRNLRSEVQRLSPQLPRDALDTTVDEVSTTDIPIMTYMLHGNAEAGVLGRAARDLKDRFLLVPGVRKVEIAGAQDDIVRIAVDPLRLNAVGLPISAVSDAIARASVDQPLGELRSGRLQAAMSLSGRFNDAEELRGLPIERTASGHVVRLSDVAEVYPDLSTATTHTFVSFAGAPLGAGVSLSLFKVPGGDTLGIVEAIKASAAGFDTAEGLELSILTDESVEVNEKLSSVFTNGVQAVVAVSLVLLLALTWREALIAALAIPVTFLGSIIVFLVLGMSMNQMVIIGMVLALGLLVDIFILVMEGMHQALFVERRSFPDAVRATLKRYALAAFAGQVTTILALMPLLFLGGLSGKFIQFVPLTAIVCLVVSYVIAFVWALPMSRLVLERRAGGLLGPSFMDRVTERASGRLGDWLQRVVVRNRWTAGVAVAATFLLFVVSLGAGATLPFELYPKEDGRNIGVTVELPPGTPLEDTVAVGRELAPIFQGKDYIESLIVYAGQRSPFAVGGSSTGNLPQSDILGFSLTLVPQEQRGGRLGYTFVPELRQELEAALHDRAGVRLAIAAQTGGPSSAAGIEYEIQGDSLAQLRDAARDLRALIAAQPGTVDVGDNTGAPKLAVDVTPNREALRTYGIPVSSLAQELALSMGETEVARLRATGTREDEKVMLGLVWPGRDGRVGPPEQWRDLSYIMVRAADGSRIDATALFHPAMDSRPQSILHKDAVRTVTVSANAEGTTAAAVIGAVAPQLGELRSRYPELTIRLAGEAQEAAETGSDMGRLFLITLLLIFTVLVLLFSSYLLPVIILCAVPMALIGTFLGFRLISMPISFPAMVGLVSLIGIVVNVSIVMVETMESYRREGRPLREAAALGAADRLRPILSTTATTVAGLILLSFSSPMWQPLCYAIIFGLLATTVLSQVVVPALYLLMARRGPESAAPAPAPASATPSS